MKKFKVGIQLYGLRNTMKEDFEGTLKKVADMGYEYVEVAGYYDKSAEELKALLDKYGLKCISVHQALDFYNEDADKAAEFVLQLIKAEMVEVALVHPDRMAGFFVANTGDPEKTGAAMKHLSELMDKSRTEHPEFYIADAAQSIY